MTLNTCIAFPAHRDWTNGPRKLHLTKKIEIEIDHVYENIFALSFADPTVSIQDSTHRIIEERFKTKEYYIDLKDKYSVFSLDTLIAEIHISPHPFFEARVEDAVIIEIFVEYYFT